MTALPEAHRITDAATLEKLYGKPAGATGAPTGR